MLLAGAVGVDAQDLGLEPGDLGLGLLGLALQAVLLDRQAVQHRRGDGLLFAQGLDRFLGLQRLLGGDPGRARGDLHRSGRLARFAFRLVLGPQGLAPAGEQHGRLQHADLGGQALVLLRRPRLAPQPPERALQLPRHVVQPHEVGLGGAQAQLGLVAAGVQARDPGRLFQDHAPVLRLGGDQLGDLPLAHQGRGIGACRGVGEQQLHVARAHLAAVDAVGRAVALVDAARDLQHRVVVELGRRGAVGIVDGERHLGVVARGSRAGAGEDHVLHPAGAHGLGGIGAHHPAQRFQQVRLATAVRSDDPGQPRLDAELGGIDEGLEPRKAQPQEVHGALGPP